MSKPAAATLPCSDVVPGPDGVIPMDVSCDSSGVASCAAFEVGSTGSEEVSRPAPMATSILLMEPPSLVPATVTIADKVVLQVASPGNQSADRYEWPIALRVGLSEEMHMKLGF